jgi:hypothetical protein
MAEIESRLAGTHDALSARMILVNRAAARAFGLLGVLACCALIFAVMGCANRRASQVGPAAPTAPAVRHILKAVDVFGSHRIPTRQVLAIADLPIGKEIDPYGESFTARRKSIDQRLKAELPLAYASTSLIVYGDDSVYMTIDLVDRGDEKRMRFAPEPKATLPDPAGLLAAWGMYEERAWPLWRQHQLTDTSCHAFHCALGFAHPELAPLEPRFIEGVPAHFTELTRVLREDKSDERRAQAAFLLAYGKDRQQIVTTLLPSVFDPAEVVRNNVLRVLAEIQEKAREVVVPLPTVTTALSYPKTTDRNKAGAVLLAMVKLDPARLRGPVLQAVGDTLIEMVALQQPNNRDFAQEILKVLAGRDLGVDPVKWRAWMADQGN